MLLVSTHRVAGITAYNSLPERTRFIDKNNYCCHFYHSIFSSNSLVYRRITRSVKSDSKSKQNYSCKIWNSFTVSYIEEMGGLNFYQTLISHPLKTIFQHKACTNKLYADSFYKVQKNSHISFEVICCRS